LVDAPGVRFCDFTGAEFSALLDVVTQFLRVARERIEQTYEDWGTGFRKERENSHDGFDTFCKTAFAPCDANLPAYEESGLIGVDLPIMLSPEPPGAVGETFVILGQDPLRTGKDFLRARPEWKGEIIVGAPYAFHSSFCRRRRTRLYWEIAEAIVRRGHRVYLTDVFKVWAEDTANPRPDGKLEPVNFGRGLDYERFLRVLEKEREVIKPSRIIALGGEARRACAEICFRAAGITKFPHPRARATAWDDELGSASRDDNRDRSDAGKREHIIDKLFPTC